MVRPPDLKDIEDEIAAIQTEKKEAIENQKFEEAANLRDKEKSLKKRLEGTLDNWKKENDSKIVTIDADEISHIVSSLTGVPIQQLEECELQKLLNMEKELEKVIVGQNEALHSLTRSLRRSRADLKDPSRPIGTFIFLGPTGVGKTLLAKTIAEMMFGDSEALIQVDMSEYMEKFNVTRLVGSPPGYVGHGDGGELTEKVRRRPYSVVLFDEIEKAHPDVMNLLLQVMEEGMITDTNGVKIDFRNTIVIMTSNVGASKVRNTGALGFGGSDGEMDYERQCEQMQDSAKKHFKPEFLNRLDEIIVFRELTKIHLREIVDIEIRKIGNRLKVKGMELIYNDDVKDFLIEKGYKPEYGARPLRRAVERHIEDYLAEEILRSNLKSGMSAKATMDGNKLLFFIEEIKKKTRGRPKKSDKGKTKVSSK
jgi:ATP-dependent Clp protease ATP-binding subunit ClpC